MTFPALVPSVRAFTSGDVPQSSQVSLSGVNTGFRRGNRRMGQSLTLGFTNLTETQLNLIKDHYIDRQGTFDIFFLSSEVWNGYTTPPTALVDAYAWRYAGPPTITDGIVGRWSVLQTVQVLVWTIRWRRRRLPCLHEEDLIFSTGLLSSTAGRRRLQW